MLLLKTASQVFPVEAKAMYFGGERIALDDPRLDKFSSDRLGLVCTVCKEPVRRRKGEVNAPHFAHFPTIATHKMEECERRRSVHGGSNWKPLPLDWSLYEGERLELFQKHFLSIIKKSIPKLDIDAIDRESKGDSVHISVQMKALNLLRRKQDVFARHIRAVNEESTELETKIACEALAYISVASSRAIFILISEYLILHREELSFNVNDSRFPKKLCIEISNLLASVDWTESFVRLSGFEPIQVLEDKRRKAESNKNRKRKVRPAIVHLHKRISEEIGDSGLFVHLVNENIYIGTSKSLEMRGREPIGFIKTKRMVAHTRQKPKQTADIKCALSSINVFQKHYRFAVFKDAIEGDFLPLLRKRIDKRKSSKRLVVIMKNCFGKLRLSKSLNDFLMSGKAQIMSGRDVIAIVTIDTLTESQYADKYMMKNFFGRSKRYSDSQRRYPKLQAAILRLIHKKYKELHNP